MSQEWMSLMFGVAEKGGRIALSMIDDSSPSLKPDQSVLTEADLAVSRLIKEAISPLVASGKHILIDEEDKNAARYLDQSQLASAEYAWVIDPIDGTRCFSNRIPNYGISIGLLKHLKPYMSMVYLPGFGEMFHCDGEQSYFTRKCFTAEEQRQLIMPLDQHISRQSVYYGNDAFFKDYEWDFTLCQMMLPSCAVIDLCWPAIGRGCGCFFNANIWDFAGSWPIYKAAGLDMRRLSDGKSFEAIDAGLFNGPGRPDGWRLNQPHILSSERNFEVIRKAIQKKSN